MDTIRTRSPEKAAHVVRRGQLAAFPTETVYGLGADAFQQAAVASIFEAKGRPADNPLIVHVADRPQIRQVASPLSERAGRLLDAFAPGPLTLILPKHPDLPSVVTAGLETVGVRMPRHDTAQAFLRACEAPVAAPSANRSGRPSPTTWQAVQEDLGGRIACILQGGHTETGVESTVLDCTSTPPTVLRPGAVPVEALREEVGAVAVQGDETETEGETNDASAPRSPGTRHRHYAPTAPVRLVDRPAEASSPKKAGYIGLDLPTDRTAFARVCVADTVAEYAREVFSFFRACDRAGCAVIYAQRVPPEDLGRALNDRLERAAAR